MRIDLDAARAARAEARGSQAETSVVAFGGEDFELPIECPWTFVEHLNAEQNRAAVADLFGDEAAERFFSHGPSVADLTEFVQGVAVAYGLGTPGNSPASRRSSSNGSRRSKRTS